MRENELHRLNKIRRYMRGETNRVYSPRKTTVEYRQIVDMSKINMLPLVVSAFAQNLFAEGYRGKRKQDNDAAWELWQDNRMDLRQSLIYRSALTYGLSYATVLKKQGGGALFTPYSPLQLTAVYDDPVNDEWPIYAITVSSGYDETTRKSVLRVDLLDSTWRYRFVKTAEDQYRYVEEPQDGSDEQPSGAHGLPETPVVRWVNVGQDLDEGPVSEVESLFPLQDQVDNTTYALLIKQQFQAFRQRWVSGMTIEQDATGADREPFKAGVDRLFQAESENAKFGEFSEGELGGLLESRQSTLSILAVLAQISPNALVLANGTVANLSAEALAALESSQQRKQAGMKTSFGESNEQMLRLGSYADGNEQAYEDRSSQIVWRDTESRSLAQVADAANKLGALSIPPEFMWEWLADSLGWSQQDLDRLKNLADKEDGLPPAPPGQQPGVPTPPSPEQLMAQGGGNVVPAGPARTAGPAGPARPPVPAGT